LRRAAGALLKPASQRFQPGLEAVEAKGDEIARLGARRSFAPAGQGGRLGASAAALPLDCVKTLCELLDRPLQLLGAEIRRPRVEPFGGALRARAPKSGEPAVLVEARVEQMVERYLLLAVRSIVGDVRLRIRFGAPGGSRVNLAQKYASPDHESAVCRPLLADDRNEGKQGVNQRPPFPEN
jgi:hypothetical protein